MAEKKLHDEEIDHESHKSRLRLITCISLRLMIRIWLLRLLGY